MLTGGTWAGIAVSDSLVYALDNAANTVQIYNLSGVSVRAASHSALAIGLDSR